MPWCDDCSRWWSPKTMPAGGACPSCGRVLAVPRRRGSVLAAAPWHFKVMLVALAGYLAYRAYWLAEWLPKHVHL